MDENTQPFSPYYSQPESPKIYLPKPAGSSSSGLTLVIPSLKSLKAAQSARTPKHRAGSLTRSSSIFQDVDNQDKKAPRPVKLKPLKEVLSKLIAQIKKKDDYAFFLHPVDVASIPGYSDIVKRPMDLGTMTDKVHRGKYRSLEDFASDFKLVTMNAKIFNPPGSIYHIEADRIEAWGLDHISKASSTVIQYETDWNIDVERDDDGQAVNVDEDEDDVTGTPMEVDNSSMRERSVSVASQPQPGSSRRGPRGPYKKPGPNAPSNNLSETLEPDGGMPGSKDGIGAFPSGSDWAKTMIALKLKGKRYKTKKERMRIERDGPPLLPDGSLDYTEMEDPFSVLSSLVPDPPSRPLLVPLYPPLFNPPPPPSVFDPSSSQTPQPQPLVPSSSTTFPCPIILPPEHTSPVFPLFQSARSSSSQPQPRRHWVINRAATTRQKGKEKDDELEGSELPAWQVPRDANSIDFGSFAVLSGALAEEMRQRGLISTTPGVAAALNETVDQEVNLDLIRRSLDCNSATVKTDVADSAVGLVQTLKASNLLANEYWTANRAIEGEDYVRDVVYGGVDGFAYVRSLAEFVDGNCYHIEEMPERPIIPPYQTGLGIPLSRWVVDNLIDPLTEGRHSLLRDTAEELTRQRGAKPQNLSADPRDGTVASQVTASLHLYPSTLIALSALLQIRLHKIDMGSLLKTPQELFISEEEWAGKGLKEKKRQRLKVKREEEEGGPDGNAMDVDQPEITWVGVDGVARQLSTLETEGPEELSEVLEYVANAIIELDRRNRAAKSDDESKAINGKASLTNGNGSAVAKAGADAEQGNVKKEDSTHPTTATTTSTGHPTSVSSEPAEDPALRNLRLNLLALAKRAPLDTIARLPKDLVPEHIRQFVPTLGSTG